MSKGLATMRRERDIKIDLIKGIGIILMVVRHARAPYSKIILLFHMAVFFIASGCLYDGSKIRDSGSLKNYVLKKIKGLWFPQFAFSVLFVLLNNVFIHLNIYTDNPEFLLAEGAEVTYRRLAAHYSVTDIMRQIVKAAFFQCQTQVGGAFWFFYTLFTVLVTYATVDYALSKICRKANPMLIKGIVSVILLLIGYYCYLNGMMLKGFSRVFSVYILIFIGESLRFMNQRVNEASHSVYKEILMMLVSAAILLIAQFYGDIDLSSNSIENPFFFLLVSLAGWFLLYGIASLIIRAKWVHAVRAISCISVHSVAIIALHFCCFKVVNAIAVLAAGQEYYMIASFPVLMYSGMWWLAYTAVGICLPLGVNYIFWQIVHIIKILLVKSRGKGL